MADSKIWFGQEPDIPWISIDKSPCRADLLEGARKIRSRWPNRYQLRVVRSSDSPELYVLLLKHRVPR